MAKYAKFPMTKKYGTKKYSLGRVRKTKRAAENVAESYRKDGYLARVGEKIEDVYPIWIWRKRR